MAVPMIALSNVPFLDCVNCCARVFPSACLDVGRGPAYVRENNVKNARLQMIGLASLLCVAGCSFSPVYLAERPFLGMQLPKGISMSDYVESGPFGTRITVAEKLAWLGARPGLDGKI